ncbi:MAG TPA: DNA repair protein RecN [Pseudomonadales bacterium]
MLRTLTVSNFALVDELEIQFGPGLTVITGESGAGKSILLGALGLVLGERADTTTIRPGSDRADVSAEFDLSGSDDARRLLVEQALDDPDQPERALVRRVVTRDGRSRAFLNGAPVTLNVLRELTAGLIDIYGQDDNVRLADPGVQRDLLDGYGVKPEDLHACREAFHAWKHAVAEHARRQSEVQASEDRAALLSYQLEELDAAAPEPGEFEEIERTHRRLSQAQELSEVVGDALARLDEEDVAGRVLSTLSRLDDDHPRLVAALETLTTISDLGADVIRDLRAFEESLSFDPETLAEMEERLSVLHDLARKHRVQPEHLPDHIESLRAELAALSGNRTSLADLEAEAKRQEQAYRALAKKISKARRQAAEAFCAAVGEHMQTLGIRGGALALEFPPRESEFGAEAVEYLCVTNPRYPAAPLSRIASGGERARISLAIQIVAAAKNQLPSLILDEADVGVGGTTADVVGRLLRSLSEHTQVICITHAPQIAALGYAHLKVSKDSEQDTRITSLAASDRVDELARMLAGARITEESRDYAKTLLAEAAG